MAAREPLAPAYLIHGSDSPKVELAVRRLRARVEVEGGSVEALDAAEAAPAEAAASCNALGLFGGLRLVLVAGVEAWEKADVAPLAEYLKAPAPDTVLALSGDKLGPKHALTGLAKAVTVLAYDLPDRKALPDWLRKRAEQAGLQLDAGAGRRLLELARDDALQLSTEVDKLAAWAGGETVHAHDVDLLCVLDPDLPPWDLTDALAGADGATALAVLGRYLDRRDFDVARVLPALARQLRQLAVAKRLVEQGAGSADVAKALDMRSPFPAKKLVQQAGRWSQAEISAAIARLARAEAETRGDSPLPDRFSLERALAEATGA